MESMHGEAVREMGLGEDEDEKIETNGGKTRLTGFGDSVSTLYLNALHLDVAIVMQKLEPRLQRWCELMFEGYTPTVAYKNAGINELNSVPILMYHRIYDMKNSETSYTGGNVDKDGYNRTSEAFEADLRSYYEMGYRMM